MTTNKTQDKEQYRREVGLFFFTSLKDVGGGATQQLPDAADAVLHSGIEERDVVDAEGRRDTIETLRL